MPFDLFRPSLGPDPLSRVLREETVKQANAVLGQSRRVLRLPEFDLLEQFIPR